MKIVQPDLFDQERECLVNPSDTRPRCRRCGRLLQNSEAISMGISRHCLKLERAEKRTMKIFVDNHPRIS